MKAEVYTRTLVAVPNGPVQRYLRDLGPLFIVCYRVA